MIFFINIKTVWFVINQLKVDIVGIFIIDTVIMLFSRVNSVINFYHNVHCYYYFSHYFQQSSTTTFTTTISLWSKIKFISDVFSPAYCSVTSSIYSHTSYTTVATSAILSFITIVSSTLSTAHIAT